MTTTPLLPPRPAHPDGATLLRNGLLFNAIVCSTSGIVSVAASSALSDWMNIDRLWLLAVGAALIGYAPMLLMTRAKSTLRPIDGKLTAMLDDVWIIAVLALAIGGFGISTGGRILLALTAIPVGVSAAMQWVGASRLDTA